MMSVQNDQMLARDMYGLCIALGVELVIEPKISAAKRFRDWSSVER